MQNRIFIILLFLMVNSVNAFAGLKASQINPVPALADLGLVASMVLSILLLLIGIRKSINLLG